MQSLVQALKNIDVSAPSIPVHSNVDGRPYRRPAEVRRLLPRQLCSPVKWEQTMHVLYERRPGLPYPNTYECGPGTSLKTILKMNNAKAVENTVCVRAWVATFTVLIRVPLLTYCIRNFEQTFTVPDSQPISNLVRCEGILCVFSWNYSSSNIIKQHILAIKTSAVLCVLCCDWSGHVKYNEFIWYTRIHFSK